MPAGRLLVFDVREGWAPLCEFLGAPVPAHTFPNINDSGEIRAAVWLVRLVTWVTVAACLIPILSLTIAPSSALLLPFSSSSLLLLLLIPAILWLAGRAVTRVVTNHTSKSKQH